MDGASSPASTYFFRRDRHGVYLARICTGRVLRIGVLTGIGPEAYRPEGVNTRASEPKYFARGDINDIFRMVSGMARVTIQQAVIIGAYLYPCHNSVLPLSSNNAPKNFPKHPSHNKQHDNRQSHRIILCPHTRRGGGSRRSICNCFV